MDKLSGDAVSIATLHASKGLEFNTVFIIQCEDEAIPFYKATSKEQIDEEKRLLFGMLRFAN
jgi:DNA helicase-2/ATP-dependent DNA helicase PcrA